MYIQYVCLKKRDCELQTSFYYYNFHQMFSEFLTAVFNLTTNILFSGGYYLLTNQGGRFDIGW